MIFAENSRKVSVIRDEPTAVFKAEAKLVETVVGRRASDDCRAVRAIVEIVRYGGAIMPRALVGGKFFPSDRPGMLTIDISTSSAAIDGPLTVSRLSTALTCGLPKEFAVAVLDELAGSRSLASGHVAIDRGAFDPVESSPLAFRWAARVLAAVFTAGRATADVEVAVRTAIRASEIVPPGRRLESGPEE